jgi:hypothetical protein
VLIPVYETRSNVTGISKKADPAAAFMGREGCEARVKEFATPLAKPAMTPLATAETGLRKTCAAGTTTRGWV